MSNKSILTRSVLFNWQVYNKWDLIDSSDKNFEWILKVWALETEQNRLEEMNSNSNIVLKSVMYEWIVYQKWTYVNPWEDHYESLVALWVIVKPVEVSVEPTEVLEGIDTQDWDIFPEVRALVTKKEFKEYCESNWLPTSWEEFKKLRNEYKNQNSNNTEEDTEIVSE